MQGDYKGAALGGISMIPGAVGWAGLAGQVAYDASRGSQARTHTQNMQIRRHTDTTTGQAKERLAINAGPSTGTGRTPFEPNPKQYTRTY